MYSYKWHVEYKDRNEIYSFIKEYISNSISRNVEHLNIYFCVISDYVNILEPG
jgi:hypothetical protein